MFPMGTVSKLTVDKLKEYNIDIDFFSDNNDKLWGTSYKDKKCISPMELSKMPSENLVVIVESAYYKEIKEQLQNIGIKNIFRIYIEKIAAEAYVTRWQESFQERKEELKALCADVRSREVVEHILSAWTMDDIPDDYYKTICSENQYFDKEIIALGDEEIFVDLGAYTGDTAESFIELCKNKFEKLHLFEMDTKTYKILLKNMGEICEHSAGIIQCYPYGVGEKRGRFVYQSNNTQSMLKISDFVNNTSGDEVAEIRTLDEILGEEKVTFIKADIEGAEMSALRGAKKIIQEQKPILAICIYHSPDDMFDVPKYIKKLVPEYNIYIRHYTELMYETVCYAIPGNRN